MSKARGQSRRRGLIRKIAKQNGFTFTDNLLRKFKRNKELLTPEQYFNKNIE